MRSFISALRPSFPSRISGVYTLYLQKS
uniref:Uncharacterized protein n=1 Tax=Anguilla anguilla TaxID=7936 RepID=A0A0E9UXV4_ANGAN